MIQRASKGSAALELAVSLVFIAGIGYGMYVIQHPANRFSPAVETVK